MTLHKFLSFTFTTLSSLSVFCQLSTQTCKLDHSFFLTVSCYQYYVLNSRSHLSLLFVLMNFREIHVKKTSRISAKKNKIQKINVLIVKHLNLYFGKRDFFRK